MRLENPVLTTSKNKPTTPLKIKTSRKNPAGKFKIIMMSIISALITLGYLPF